MDLHLAEKASQIVLHPQTSNFSSLSSKLLTAAGFATSQNAVKISSGTKKRQPKISAQMKVKVQLKLIFFD